MKKIAIVLKGIALVAGVGIWWYNSSKDNQENQDNDKYEQSDLLYGRFIF